MRKEYIEELEQLKSKMENKSFDEWVEKELTDFIHNKFFDKVRPIMLAAWQAALSTRQFDEISIDVSTGEHDAGVRAFASMPPVEIMDSRGKRVALFEGYLNNNHLTVTQKPALSEAELVKAYNKIGKWHDLGNGNRVIYDESRFMLEHGHAYFKALAEFEGENVNSPRYSNK